MFEKLKAMFAEAPAAEVVETPEPILRDANGRRVYHEFFIADAPDTDGNWQWTARVYSSAPPKEGRGAQQTQATATAAALAWCGSVKKSIAR